MDSDFLNKLFQSIFANGNFQLILSGLAITLEISVGAVILGVILGFILSLMRLSKFKLLNILATIYISVIRGTPALTQILIVYFAVFASIRNIGIPASIIALGINSGAYVAEIIRAGLLSVDVGQKEAGLSLGLSQSQTLRYILVPQAVKNILPALANEFISLVKETSVVGYIGVQDLTRVGQMIMSKSFNTAPLFVSAFIYFIIVSILTFFLHKFEKWLRATDAN